MAHLEVCSVGDHPELRRVVRKRIPFGGASKLDDYVEAIREALEADPHVRYIWIGTQALDDELADADTAAARQELSGAEGAEDKTDP